MVPRVVSSSLAILAVAAHRRLHGSKLDYIGLGVAAAIGWTGLPGPGEAALIAAGVSASRGSLDIASVIAVAWLGATVGGIAGWLIGRHGGRRALLAGRWMRRRRERALEHGNRFFERYGLIAVYFVPSWAAGVNAMSAARFLPANAVCALVWALLVGLGSYWVGPSIRDIVGDIGLVGALLLVALAIVAALLSRRRFRRSHG
jgi:membrane protein DedA with SNARE-associated domain